MPKVKVCQHLHCQHGVLSFCLCLTVSQRNLTEHHFTLKKSLKEWSAGLHTASVFTVNNGSRAGELDYGFVLRNSN